MYIKCRVSFSVLAEESKMREYMDKVVSLCKAHSKLRSMACAFDLIHFGQI